MTTFATADQIARAVVAASRLVGADPIQTVDGRHFARGQAEPRARLIAFAALTSALPKANVSAIARGLGYTYKGSVVRQKVGKDSWWRNDLVAAVAEAVMPRGCAPVAPVTEAPKPAAQEPLRRTFAPGARIIDRRSRGVVHLGEPPLERSALVRREPEPTEDSLSREFGSRRPKPVTLPRLACLERGDP